MSAQEDGETLFRFVMWNVNDYLAGTAGLTAEQEGVYMRFLMQLYSNGKPLPDDDAWMSRLLRLSVRVWRRVKESLAELGKIIIRNSALTNSRFEAERIKRAEDHQKRAAAAHKRWAQNRKTKAAIEPTLPKVSAKFPESFGETLPQKSEKANKINDDRVKEDMLSRIHKPESIEKEKKESSSRLTDSDLSAVLEKAAGACLKNPAAAPGLLVMSQPRRWLEQGCDLDKDVLPAIRAVAAKSRSGSISNWAYFTGAVVDAKAARSAPLPQGQAVRGAAVPQSDHILAMIAQERREREQAERERQELESRQRGAK